MRRMTWVTVPVRLKVVATIVVDMSINDSDEEDLEGSLASNGFAVLSDNRSGHAELEVLVPVRPRRRLILVSQDPDVEVSDHEWDSDTDSIGGASDVEVVDVPAPTLPETPIELEPRIRAFASLDPINFVDQPPGTSDAICPMDVARCVSITNLGCIARNFGRRASEQRLEGHMRVEAALLATEDADFQTCTRRHRLPTEVGRSFEDGHWIELFTESAACAEKVHTQFVGGAINTMTTCLVPRTGGRIVGSQMSS